MLDDLKLIHERDKSDALGIAAKSWKQYKHNYGFVWEPPREVKKVVVAGMGGSALAAQAVGNAPELKVPFQVVRNYDLPGFVDQDTLLICSSYSGNTEETLSALQQGLQNESKPMIVVVASGGKLIDIAHTEKLPHVKLPGDYQPRMTFGYQFRALQEILSSTGVLDKSCMSQLEEIADWLAEEVKKLDSTVPTAQNPAMQLAQEVIGKSIVVYSGPKLFPAAYKWKISFNENAKTVAWCNQYPEFNHNEFIGWTSHPVDKPYSVIELRSNLEHPRTQKRFEVSEKLLSGKRPFPDVVEIVGDTELKQLLWAVQLGDFVSLYLALLNGLDPTPVDLIEKLKNELNS